MKKREFTKKAIKFYSNYIKWFFRSFVPKTRYITYFSPRPNYDEFLNITTEWMGQTIKNDTYMLAHRAEREKFLKELLENGLITEAEITKYLADQIKVKK